MRLEGWNHIPDGYGARFDLPAAPRWLRVLFRTPFLDRFAYPLLVKRGHGYLQPSPHLPAREHPTQLGDWRIDPPGYEPPGSTAWLDWGK